MSEQHQMTPEEVLAMATGAVTDLYKGIKTLQGMNSALQKENEKLKAKPEKEENNKKE